MWRRDETPSERERESLLTDKKYYVEEWEEREKRNIYIMLRILFSLPSFFMFSTLILNLYFPFFLLAFRLARSPALFLHILNISNIHILAGSHTHASSPLFFHFFLSPRLFCRMFDVKWVWEIRCNLTFFSFSRRLCALSLAASSHSLLSLFIIVILCVTPLSLSLFSRLSLMYYTHFLCIRQGTTSRAEQREKESRDRGEGEKWGFPW